MQFFELTETFRFYDDYMSNCIDFLTVTILAGKVDAVTAFGGNKAFSNFREAEQVTHLHDLSVGQTLIFLTAPYMRA